jgi:hypothetical protein
MKWKLHSTRKPIKYVDASLSLKADQADVDLAFSLTDGQIDAVNDLLGTKANQVDMENNATTYKHFRY